METAQEIGESAVKAVSDTLSETIKGVEVVVKTPFEEGEDEVVEVEKAGD